VVFKGDITSKVALVGLGPGLVEERSGRPFEGPAGDLLEDWLGWIGKDIKNFYVSNVTHCRFTAPKGSGKQNLTPDPDMLHICADRWLSQEIGYVNPNTVIVVGGAAAVGMRLIEPGTSITPLLGSSKQVDLYGRERTIFFLRHPASLLYARPNDPSKWATNQKYQALRLEYKQCFTKLKELIS